MNLPNFDDAFEYENNFWLSDKINRISKVIAHYELYKKVINLSGDVVECGIFKGASFVRFAMMREILGNPSSKKLIGFDSFGKFPKTNFKHDKKALKDWTAVAGEHSISRKEPAPACFILTQTQATAIMVYSRRCREEQNSC